MFWVCSVCYILNDCGVGYLVLWLLIMISIGVFICLMKLIVEFLVYIVGLLYIEVLKNGVIYWLIRFWL